MQDNNIPIYLARSIVFAAPKAERNAEILYKQEDIEERYEDNAEKLTIQEKGFILVKNLLSS